MKAKVMVFVALLFAKTISTNAQTGRQRLTVEDRVKLAMNKLTSSLNLDTTEQNKTIAVLTDFYTAQDKMRADARASGNRPERSEFIKILNDRDDKLKAIFTGDQYKKFKDEVEPSLRPQRSGMQSGATN